MPTDLAERMICSERDIVKGRFLNRESHNQVVLEEVYAVTRGILIGESIHIAGMDYKVIGLVNTGIRPGRADVYMPIHDVDKVIDALLQIRFRDFATFIGVESETEVAVEIIEKVKKILGANSFIASYDSN